jgi:hypothetical protein
MKELFFFLSKKVSERKAACLANGINMQQARKEQNVGQQISK